MKKITQVLIGLTLTAAAIISCKKHEIIEEPISTPPQAIAELNNQFLDDKKQTFTVNADVYNVIYGNQGTKIELSGNNFTDVNGNPLIGMVDIELIELYTLSAMISANKVTMAEQNGQILPLSSGGEFYISVTQNGNPVNVANALSVTTAPVTNPVSNMQLFNGNVDNDGDILWSLDNPATLPLDTAGLSYIFDWDGGYNWINCDYFSSSPSAQTNVKVLLPTYCEEVNTMVYGAFPDGNSVTSFYHDSGSEFATSPNYTLPEGLNLYTVAITIHNNQLKYAIQQSIIGTNHVVNINSMTEVGSLAELEIILQSYL